MTERERLMPGQGEQIVLAALTKAGRHGLNTQKVANALRASCNRASTVLCQLMRAGQVQRRCPGGRAPAHWWLAGQGPKVQTVSTAPRTSSQPPARLSLPADAPAIVPQGLQVTVCPSGRDTRFTFTPPPGWRGQITHDWRARRAQERKAC